MSMPAGVTFSGSAWSEPCGEFGPGYSDFEGHERPAIRFGKRRSEHLLELVDRDHRPLTCNELRERVAGTHENVLEAERREQAGAKSGRAARRRRSLGITARRLPVRSGSRPARVYRP